MGNKFVVGDFIVFTRSEFDDKVHIISEIDPSRGEFKYQLEDRYDWYSDEYMALAPNQNFNGWIRIGDYLPRVGEDVLVYVPYGNGNYIIDTDVLLPGCDGQASRWEMCHTKPTHWRPMILPPAASEY